MSIDYTAIKTILDQEFIQAGVRVHSDGTITEIDVPCFAESYSSGYFEDNVWKFEGHWVGEAFTYEGWTVELQHSSAFLTDGFIEYRIRNLFESGAEVAEIGVTTIEFDGETPDDERTVEWAVLTRKAA